MTTYEVSWPSEDPDAPRKLTLRSKVELVFAAVITLIRVAAILGLSVAFLLFSLNFEMSYLLWCVLSIVVYAIGTGIMAYMLKQSDARIEARHASAQQS